MYKLIGLFVLVATVVGNDLTVGHKEGGKKIIDQKVEASPAIWRQVKNVTFNATDGDVISSVVITDLRTEKDGEAIVVEGGEGHQNVTIELKSPAVFRGFEFNVEVYAVNVNQHAFPTEQETSHKPEVGPEVQGPVTVGADSTNDSLRKTRKTEDNKDTTTKVSVSSDVTTVSVTPTPHSPTTVSSTTQVNKVHDGVKINIPINTGIETGVSTQSTQSTEKVESDVIDPVSVKNQPTHMNNSDSTPKTTENTLPATKEFKDPQLRNVRQSDDRTTEADATISTTTSYTTTEDVSTLSEESEVAPTIPYFSWDVKPIDTVKSTGEKGLNPPQIFGSNNAAVSHPKSMAPIPYTH